MEKVACVWSNHSGSGFLHCLGQCQTAESDDHTVSSRNDLLIQNRCVSVGSCCVYSSYSCQLVEAHRNDMENIFPFLFLGAVYSLIGPSLAVARAHFLVFFLFRMLHTVAYLCVLRAPTRSLAYVVAQVPCVSMAVQVLAAVASSW
uniref:Prostaglandin E synthase n=1 Tax=Oncorhynchus mykiss TaxID=8022 RepID=A0A8C7NMJ0_ONCMY